VTGAEHYRAAEELLASVTNVTVPAVQGQGVLAAAQVHATLALAASTVDVQKVGRAINEAVREARRSSW
jgi:hypothetical protein